MSVNGEPTTTTTTTTDGNAASTPTATPPSQSAATADASAGKTAPPVDASRDAFARLARGDSPADVNKAFLKSTTTPAAAAKPATRATPKPDQAAAKPQPGDDGKEPAASAAAGAAFPEGTDAKDLNVLKRAQIDPETWAAIPPTNRTKILNNLRTAQATADREFQKARQAGKPGAGGTDAAGTQATQQTAGAEDAETLTGDDAAPEDAQLAATTAGQPKTQPASHQQPAAAAQAAAGGAAFDPMQLLDAKDRETLEMLGGSELSETFGRGLSAVAKHFETQAQNERAQLAPVLDLLMNNHIDGQVQTYVSKLAAQPGMDALQDGHADATKNVAALRSKALLLHRAGGGNPAGYSFQEALQDASASLFKTNIQQSTQAALLRGRTRSLAGTADRGDGTRTNRQGLTPQERGRAIFAELQAGATPEAARAAVDGA